MVSKKGEEEANKLAEEGKMGWQKEKWYGTVYKVEPLPEELLRKLESLPAHGSEDEEKNGISPVFRLPGANEFIPTEFTLRADEEPTPLPVDDHNIDDDVSGEKLRRALNLPTNVPVTALQTVPRADWSRLVLPSLVSPTLAEGVGSREVIAPMVKVWHKMDRSHRVPRSVIAAKLWTPEPYGSPEAAMNARMFVRLLKEDLKSWAYDAGIADLRYSLEMTTQGLQLSVAGFSSKVALLLSKILGHIGELLAEYGELGALLEGSASNAAVEGLAAAAGGGLETGRGGGLQKEVELTERQRLLYQRFENQRESFLRTYRNVDKEQPHETAAYYIRQVNNCRFFCDAGGEIKEDGHFARIPEDV